MDGCWLMTAAAGSCPLSERFHVMPALSAGLLVLAVADAGEAVMIVIVSVISLCA
jgi:hypothetical protein